MVIYRGFRRKNGEVIVERKENGERTELALRLDLCSHSPCGFEWGYGGSGPAQLALALLADRLPDDPDLAYDLHQSFKWVSVCNFARSGWIIDSFDIDQWIFSQLDRYEIVPAGGASLVDLAGT